VWRRSSARLKLVGDLAQPVRQLGLFFVERMRISVARPQAIDAGGKVADRRRHGGIRRQGPASGRGLGLTAETRAGPSRASAAVNIA
jgi:hypothetical protein